MQGLNALHHQLSTSPDAAKKEAAAQFESLLVQMLMKSMRDANHALAENSEGDSVGAQQMDLYNDLFDKQLSLVMSHSDTGLAKAIETSLDKSNPLAHTPQTMPPSVLPVFRTEKSTAPESESDRNQDVINKTEINKVEKSSSPSTSTPPARCGCAPQRWAPTPCLPRSSAWCSRRRRPGLRSSGWPTRSRPTSCPS